MSVTARIDYLERLELYQTEKPYMTTFEIPESVGSTTNHRYIAHEAEIRDAKQSKDAFSLRVHGFEFHDWPTQLQRQDFEDDETIISLYYPEIRAQMQRAFPSALDIHILTHLRRKRTESTDSLGDELETGRQKYPNTISYAHTDFSPHGAQVAVQRLLDEHESLRDRRYEVINAWRVTKGPNRDWPLALCDYTSLDLADVEVSDVIHKNKIGESTRLYYNERHRWYYLDNQTTSEVVLFRNVDSTGWQVPFAMHLAFPNPNCSIDLGGSRRESIEVRFVLFH